MPASRRYRRAVGIARRQTESALEEQPPPAHAVRRAGERAPDAIDHFLALAEIVKAAVAQDALDPELRVRLASARDAALRVAPSAGPRRQRAEAIDAELSALLRDHDRLHRTERPVVHRRRDRMAGAFVPAWERRQRDARE